MREYIRFNLIKRCIEQEFIQANYCGVCLAGSLIFYEVAKKYDITTKVQVGTKLYSNGTKITPHFWIEHNDIIYDPTVAITQHYLPHNLNVTYTREYKLKNAEDIKIIEVYQAFEKNKSATAYFSEAPKHLLEVRKNIYQNVEKIFNK